MSDGLEEMLVYRNHIVLPLAIVSGGCAIFSMETNYPVKYIKQTGF